MDPHRQTIGIVSGMTASSRQEQRKRVCVIGAGPSGLTSIRQLRQEGHEVICFEKLDVIGGLWHYRDHVVDGVASVARSTVTNTSKEFVAFSDFPPPPSFPNFMPNSFLLKYLQLYAERFDLEKDVVFNRRVTRIDFADDHAETGRWKVMTRDTKSREEFSDIFDGVMIATGHHMVPQIPVFEGQDEFAGRILHTHSFKHASQFAGQRVCVIGAGNSALDAAVDLSQVASRVYLSIRRNGVWVQPRVGRGGWPLESWMVNRAVAFLMRLLPASCKNRIHEFVANSYMDHQLYGIRPDHPISQQMSVTNDGIQNAIISGRVVVRPIVTRFTEHGVVFQGDEQVTEVETVILGTGYRKDFSAFVDPGIIGISERGLYKVMFNADLPHAHTIALIGIVHPAGPIHPVSEMQARWFARLMTGDVRLPGRAEMREVIRKDIATNDSGYYATNKQTLQVSYASYLMQLAHFVGCQPLVSKYLTSDPLLWYHLIFHLYTSYQFRLEGRHKWTGARQVIVDTQKRILTPLKYRMVHHCESVASFHNNNGKR